MKRTSRIVLVFLAACTLGGCASSRVASSPNGRTDRRTGDSLGYAIFGHSGSSSQLAKADRDR